MIKLTLVLFTTIFFNSIDSLEQRATDYFFNVIFRGDYQGYKVIEFRNQTDTARYHGIIHRCNNWDADTKNLIVSASPGESTVVKVNVKGIKVKNERQNSARLKVYVYSKVKIGASYFVSIVVYKKLHFVNYYLIQFNENGDIIDMCKTGEII